MTIEHVARKPTSPAGPAINLAPSATDTLAAEIDRLAVWYDRAVAATAAPRWASRDWTCRRPGSWWRRRWRGRCRPHSRSKAIDDLKAYYLEAASAFPDPGSSRTRKAWLWDETILAKSLLALQPKLAASPDRHHQILGNLTMIPATERHRLSRPIGAISAALESIRSRHFC
jgi:hypothetical protein